MARPPTIVNSPSANCLKLEKQVTDRWQLRDAFIVPEIDPPTISRNLAAAAAQYIELNLGKDETLLGFGWGNTVSLTLKYLSLTDEITALNLMKD